MELALGVVGAGVGSIFGGAGAMWGWAIGTTLGGAISYLTTQPPSSEQGRLDDLKLTISSNAAPIPVVYGRARVGGNVIWATDLKETVRQTGGGKGKPRVVEYRYSCHVAILVSKGSISSIRKIWADDVVIFDSSQTPATRETVTIYGGSGRIYPSAAAQNADPLIASIEGSANTPAYRGRCYVVLESFDVTPYGNRLPTFQFEIEQASITTVSAVVQGELLRAGVPLGKINTAAVSSDALRGFLVVARQPVRDTVEGLLRAFAADLIEADGELRVVKRGGSSALTIPTDHLGAASGDSPAARYETRRTPDVELPTRYDVAYIDSGKQYQQGLQSATRQTKPHIQDAATLTLAAIMEPDTARQIAERLLYTAWRERELFRLPVLPRYLWLAPADVVTVTIGGVDRRVRIEQMDLAPIGEIALTVVPDATDVLTQVTSGVAQTASSPSALAAIPSQFLPFSGVELQDDHWTTAGFYVVAGGANGWQGGRIWYSPDSGTTWIDAGYIAQGDAIGVTTGTLATWSSASGWDSTNTVGVTLACGQLAPASMTEVTYGFNRALVGNEVLGFSGASLVSGTTYTLSSLLRRLRNTSGGGHATGERFATLDNPFRVQVPDSLIGATIQVKVVSPYQTLADVTAKTVVIGTPTGAPYATPNDIANATSGLFQGTGIVWQGTPPKTLNPDENFAFISYSGTVTDDSIYLPLRANAQGVIEIWLTAACFATIKRASGSSDDLEFPNMATGGSTTGTSKVVGNGSNMVRVWCVPKKGSTTRWIVIAI